VTVRVKREKVIEWRGGIGKREYLIVFQGKSFQGNEMQYKEKTLNLTLL